MADAVHSSDTLTKFISGLNAASEQAARQACGPDRGKGMVSLLTHSNDI